MPAAQQQSPTLTMPSKEVEDLSSFTSITMVPLELLGEGGMGRVVAAQEPILGRVVAVKTTRESSEDRADHEACLLREARILAKLEHPNILPTYGITKIDGHLGIVLKRIHGKAWSEIIDSCSTDRNIDILLRVMDAVAFAHSRGYLHRDLKPSNVMVGQFAEVYLMDWGLALPVRDSPAVFCASGSLPYMAPEMLCPQEENLSERTDVYLLGAILYQIITGEPPHGADSRSESIESIERSQPRFSQAEDVELVAICQRAMRPRPEARFGSVESFAEAIRDYRRHESSRILVRRAQGMAVMLEPVLDEMECHRQDVYELYGPCRFAFQEALRGWPGNAKAWSGLRETTERVAEYEMASGAPGTALSLLAEVGISQGELAERAQEQLAVRNRAEEEVGILRRLGDRTISSGARQQTVACLGLGWTLVPLLLEAIGSSPYLLALNNGLALALWIVLGLLGRTWVHSTIINRQAYSLVLAGSLVLFVATLGLSHIGMPVAQIHIFMSLHFFGMALAAVFLVEWRIWPAAIALFAAFLVGAREPALALLGFSAANGILAINALVIDRRRL